MNIQSIVSKAKSHANAALEYAKSNPGDILLGIATLVLVDASESLEQIETYEAIQTFIDVEEYRGA